jgi:hypothetical protein
MMEHSMAAADDVAGTVDVIIEVRREKALSEAVAPAAPD